jgi:hypothetical protein
MSYFEDSSALFRKNAKAIFSEYAASYQEKESHYLQGTTFLRNRVLNGLVEMMMKELRAEMDSIIREYRKNTGDDHTLIKDNLTLVYDHYVSRFRNLEFSPDGNGEQEKTHIA